MEKTAEDKGEKKPKLLDITETVVRLLVIMIWVCTLNAVCQKINA